MAGDNHVLLTIFLKHDQSKNLAEIQKIAAGATGGAEDRAELVTLIAKARSLKGDSGAKAALAR